MMMIVMPMIVTPGTALGTAGAELLKEMIRLDVTRLDVIARLDVVARLDVTARLDVVTRLDATRLVDEL